MDWRPVPVEPGDLLFFDSYTPHYSETNTTDRPRRAGYLTYNAASLGDHRERYYADKLAEFDRAGGDFDGERVRISISDDGRGPAEGAPGLGASLLDEVAPGRWSLRANPAGAGSLLIVDLLLN